jgi:hypothetical protein
MLGLTFVALLSAAVPARQSKPATKPNTARRTVELLDQFAQDRFRQTDKKFGIGRMRPSVEGHNGVNSLIPDSQAEKKLLAEVAALGHESIVAFLRVDHPPGGVRYAPRDVPGEVREQPRLSVISTLGGKQKTIFELERSTTDALSRAAVEALPELRKKGAAERSVGPRLVMLRPVRALASCLKCHVAAKRGDILGVMVYGVSRDPNPVPEKTARGPLPRSRR